ncbi:MAG: peptidylprolyl isomerase [Saprospiraceae bacterium]
MKNIVYFLFFAFAIIMTSCGGSHTAEFDFELTTGEAPVEIAFNNTSKNTTSYEWNFGDGSASSEQSPTKMFYYPGTYNVTLTTINNGKRVETTKSFTLRDAPKRIVEIETEFGVMKAELFNYTPKHRDNFIKLAEEGYYDGTLFHRVMQGFMAQGGDPDSKNATPDQILGRGELDYTLEAEIVPGAYHYKGALAAARQPDRVNPNKVSSACQFYIVHGAPHTSQQLQQYVNQKAQKGIRLTYTQNQVDFYNTQGGTPILDMDYTVFGQVIEGIHIIDKLAAVPVGANNRPTKDVPMKVRVVK